MLSLSTFACKIISAWLGMCVRAKSLHSCPTPYDPMDCSLPGSSVHGILQSRILEWVAMPSSRGSSDPGIKPTSLMSPALVAGFFTFSATWEAHFLLKLEIIQGLLHFHYSVQFSSVTQSCPTLCNPMNHSTPELPVHHQLPEFTQTHVY